MTRKTVTAIVIDDDALLDLETLCHAINAENDFIIEMVEHELIRPIGQKPQDWRFDSRCIRRARIAISFQRDLDVNLSGISIALDLLERINRLEEKLETLKKLTE